MADIIDIEAIRRNRRAVREGCKLVWRDDLGDIVDEQSFPTEEDAADALARMFSFELSGDRILWLAVDTGAVFYREVFPTWQAAEAEYLRRVREKIETKPRDE